MGYFSVLDFVIVAVYAVMIIGLGFFFSRSMGKEKSTEDYFLAGKSLPWWAIGASLIAANISAEQYIGMSGSGFASGLAIASYEFMSALTLIIVGKFFLPIFIKQGIYTIPEFVEKRFSTNLKTILAVFWLALFIFVNLTSILFLGGKAIDTIVGTGDGSLIMPAIFILAIVAVAYSLYGGLSAVAWTDVIQVILLVLGGVVTTVFALKAVSPDSSIVNGISHVTDVAGDKFDMILSRDNPEYSNLPGIYVLIGGLWVANLYYWGFNQYIIQRTLAAKSISEAQHGIVFAAFLKMLIPFIIVIPGIIAWVMYSEGYAGATEAFELPDGTLNNDKAFPWLISTLLPTGLKGLVLAALSAAIVSSLASMLNSISTIFTMDIYKPYVNPTAESKKYVNVGRITAVVALFVAIVVSPLLSSMDQMFQYIQEYTGLVSPGILAVFIMGLFWKKATNKGAVWGILLSIPIALAFKILPFEMPFMDQMFYTFLFTMVIIMMVSLTSCPTEEDEKGIPLTADLFKTDKVFNICAYIICVLLAVIYTIFF